MTSVLAGMGWQAGICIWAGEVAVLQMPRASIASGAAKFAERRDMGPRVDYFANAAWSWADDPLAKVYTVENVKHSWKWNHEACLQRYNGRVENWC
jgi:hypothetical protein